MATKKETTKKPAAKKAAAPKKATTAKKSCAKKVEKIVDVTGVSFEDAREALKKIGII